MSRFENGNEMKQRVNPAAQSLARALPVATRCGPNGSPANWANPFVLRCVGGDSCRRGGMAADDPYTRARRGVG